MPKKRGRPKQEIDPEMVRNLAMIGATIQTIAEYVGCSRDTIENRFRPEIEEGRSNGRVRALGKVFQAAMNGQMRALELYLINQCGWTLKPETVVNVVSTSSIVDNRSPRTNQSPLGRDAEGCPGGG